MFDSISPNTLAAVESYLKLGFSIIPQMPGAKKPCVKWKPYQHVRSTIDDWKTWLTRWPDAGIAVVLGPISGLFAIDVDGQEGHDALIAKLGSEPIAPKVHSGSGKPFRYHLFFKHPALDTSARFTPWSKKLEFRGNRGIIILPPSRHHSGNTYQFALGQSFDDMALPELPALIMDELASRNSQKSAITADEPRNSESPDDLGKVQRLARAYIAKRPPAIKGKGGDKTTYTVACDLVLRFGLSIQEALPLFQEYNQRCVPKWSEEQLRHKLERANQETGKRGTKACRVTPDAGSTLGNNSASNATISGNAIRHHPAVDAVRDFGMIDPEKANVFEIIGATHGMFENVRNWPTLDELREQTAVEMDTNLFESIRRTVDSGMGLTLDQARKFRPRVLLF